MPVIRGAAWAALVACSAAGACAVSFPEIDYQTVAATGDGGAGRASASTSSRATGPGTVTSSSASGGSSATAMQAGGGGSTSTSTTGVGPGGGCTGDGDCPTPPNPCEAPRSVQGVCAIQDAPAETTCSNGGVVCDGDGTCVDCVLDSDCPPQECQSVACTANQCMAKPASGVPCGNGMQCENGSCTGCTQASQCTNAGVCQVDACQVATGQCVPTNAHVGTPCSGPTGGKYCDGNGDCSIECETATDCTVGIQACRLPTCTGNVCGTMFAPIDTPCTSMINGNPGFCAASGSCVDCVSDGDCPLCDRCTNANKCTSIAIDVQDPGRCDDTHGGCGTKCACDSGACKRENGQVCSTATQCATSTCSPVGVADACGLPQGTTCTQAIQCASQVCTAGTCQ